jgi:hypothetical protein
MELCELASNEQDQDKLGALFEGILGLLETNGRGLEAPLMACHTTHQH